MDAVAETRNLNLLAETLPLTFTDAGQGSACLLLHGGAGPASMAPLGEALAATSRVIVPTHPGFNGTPRCDRFSGVDDLVLCYLALIERLELRDVLIIGNSVGGWIAAEIGLRRSPCVTGLVLLNTVGIETGSAKLAIADPMTMTPAERGAMAFHDPKRFAIMPAGPEAAAAMAQNQAALRVYAGAPFMHEPTLRSRLADLSAPTLIAWGASDRIVDADYGRLFAASIPGCRFELIDDAGHFPQIEKLDMVMRLIGEFRQQIAKPLAIA